jgi:hypothetical protein
VKIVSSRQVSECSVARAVLYLGLFAACADGREFSGALPTPDGQVFVSDVYPILLRDCAFVACHGAPDRFFRVYGPGRVRFDLQATKPDDPMTLQEILYSYDRSRSMLATADKPQEVLLLSKPLEPAAGGQGHKGVDDLGRNLFASARDPSYAKLAAWARSTGSPPTAAQVAAANALAEMAKQDAP